ncbi:uncharacterized protein Z519_11013 [Cladophialophora bantiana CBS 173.52]|uniref:Major facilitator superfamily (MFS) profile domain-containing protein n=1 Tax=Cladophialophora bantiana (strain ATCC 10958 / CBS 173.52 / CDC B-1940 / NIH 8579) TaxID=1442370 RepID=A0A0D2HV95_CLAB1|nr:uncharacterized protein Z519_11013 [Cladophialophora bantiana CBS 173.52]KIW88444.1 hypothetical protein Z519_11013 [Cladophialophora bantiana CBS 173.52]
MPLGIIDVKTDAAGHHVPGTVLLEDSNIYQHSHVKKGTGKEANIILVPQPSNDPNDPLNWPWWQRDLILILYCYLSLLVIGGIGPVLASLALVLVEEFGITFTQVSLLTGYQLCAVGAVAIFVSALCRKFGKRPGFVISATLCFAGCLWAGAANSYGSLVGARVLQGLGIAVYESVTFAVIGDMYHVHQRGTRMAIFVVANVGIAHLPSIVAGKVTMDLGWRYVFWILCAFMGLGWILIILFGWETAYNRDALFDTDTSSENNIEVIEIMKTEATHEEKTTGDLERTTLSDDQPKVRDSYLKRLRLYSGTYDKQSLLWMIIKPLIILINPVVLWAVLFLALTQVFILGLAFTLAQVFGVPPYSLNTAQLGYMLAGPMVGGFLGCLVCGLASDPAVRWASKINGGVYEPEFRLWLSIGTPLLSALGYFLFGNMTEQGKSPVAISVIFGITFGSVQFSVNSISTYLVDGFRNISIETFILAMTVKNFLFFGFSYFVNDWVAGWGPAKSMDTMGAIELGLCLTTIPIYIYGKKLRAWWHNHDVFSKF